MPEKEFVLEMLNMNKDFPGVKALNDVTFRLRPGTVHALVGENGAGKSTLMKCLFGIYNPDSGQIRLGGREVVISDSKTALGLGISMIHQELHPIPYRSVMENIWLGRFPMKGFGFLKLVDHKKMYRDTEKLFAELNINLRPDVQVKDISISMAQSMEIAKATSYGAKVIIMDEPTSSLTENEVEHLFKIIRDLKSKGVAIIYISHKMEEILRISDDVTIMRDGNVIGTWPAPEISIESIISKMVGRDLAHRFPERNNKLGSVILKVEGLTSPYPKCFQDISFELRKGEILGIGGLVGAQRTELVEALFGLRSVAKGKIFINGKEVRIRTPLDAKRHKIALLTEDRRESGVIPMLSVMENTVIANLGNYMKLLFLLDEKKRKADTKKSVELFRIKTPSIKQKMMHLSGGNQQKVLLARWLLTEPEILILDEPTRGIDVGAKFEIHALITELASQGKSIIIISSEMPELIGMSDRIMVMCEGKQSGTIDGKGADQEEIIRLATRFMT